jgi:hypothetical protein
MFNRKPADKSKVFSASFMAAGDKMPEKDTIHGFELEDSFTDWLQSAGFKDAYNKLSKRNSEIEKAQFASSLSQLEHEQKNLIDDLKGSTRSSSLDVPAIYEHINFDGGFVPLNGNIPYPRLRWFGFNDLASSAIAGGVCVLYEHDWFKGRNFAVIGKVNFLFDFNDVASSVSADIPIGR